MIFTVALVASVATFRLFIFLPVLMKNILYGLPPDTMMMQTIERPAEEIIVGEL